MRAKTAPLLILITSSILAGCFTPTVIEHRTNPGPSITPLKPGTVIAVVQPEIDYNSTRFAIDLRDVKLTVNGQEIELQGKYIEEEEEDMSLGHIGILDVNIYKRLKVPERLTAALVLQDMLDHMGGTKHYHFPFINKLKEGEMGIISDVPITMDTSTQPNTPVFTETPPEPFFKEIRVVRSEEDTAGCDYVLVTEFSLSNEVVQVIEINEDVQRQYLRDQTRVPQNGDIFLCLTATVLFELRDVKTGKVLLSEKSKGFTRIWNYGYSQIYMPINRKDQEAYRKLIKGYDLPGMAAETIEKAMVPYYHLMLPFYVTTGHTVKVEE